MKKKYFKHSTKHPIDVHGGCSICHVFPGVETSAKFPGVVGSIQPPNEGKDYKWCICGIFPASCLLRKSSTNH